MAQLKDTTVTGNIAVSGSATIGGGAEITGGDLDLYVGTGDSPAVVFKRGTLTDNYNDWRIQDRGGWFYVDERGANSSTWTNRMSINTTGVVTASTFSGAMAWDNITNKPALTTSDIAAGTDETNKLVSAKTLSEAIGSAGGGTVTSVTISGTSPINASGTVTSTGTLTVSHENSGVTEKTTQALYPFKVNKTGHITSVGTAVTVPTAGTTATAVGTSASGGSATTWSKSDHVHSLSSSTITSALGYTPYNSTNPDGYITANDVPQELYVITVTLNDETSGTSDKTSAEIAAAAAAGKLPVVKVAYGTAAMVAALAAVDYDSSEGTYYAFFIYENQAMNSMQYATLTIVGSFVSLRWKNGYVAKGDNISDLINDEGYITFGDVPTAGTTATAVGTTSSGGSATTWSKSDHVHSISSSTITSALGYTPYSNSNPDGYLTQSTLGAALQANTALTYELVYHEAVWEFGQFTPAYYAIADTLANVVANISSDRKVIFRQSLNTGKYNYWQPWFNNPNSDKIGLYRFEKDDGKLYHVVFEPDSQGTGLTGTEVEPYYLNQYDPYAVGKIITTSSISDNPNNYLSGSWTLIDKEFANHNRYDVTSAVISANTTNTNSVSLIASRMGHDIYLQATINNKVAINTTNLELFTLKTSDGVPTGLNALGLSTRIDVSYFYFLGYCDNASAAAMMDIDYSGRVRSLNVITRGSATSIAAGNVITATFTLHSPAEYMLDSYCDKFYWRRDS